MDGPRPGQAEARSVHPILLCQIIDHIKFDCVKSLIILPQSVDQCLKYRSDRFIQISKTIPFFCGRFIDPTGGSTALI